MTIDQMDELIGLFHQLAMDPNGDLWENTLELMNYTLQCLGGLRLLAKKLENLRNINYYSSLDNSNSYNAKEYQLKAVKKIFQIAVNRLMESIISGQDLDNLDPSRHIVESFPRKGKIGSKEWLAGHWCILGDSSQNFYEPQINSESKNNNPNLDNRIIMTRQLKEILPETFLEKDIEDRTILHIASRLDSVPLFQEVLSLSRSLKGGFDLSEPNRNNALPLHNAARFSHHPDVVENVRIEYPEAIHFENKDSMLPLHWAAVKNRSLDIVNNLIKNNPQALSHPNVEGYSIIHCAGQNDCLEIVRALTEAYKDGITIRDNEKAFPFHHACYFNHNMEVVKYLYSLYPEALIAPQEHGVLPIHLAASNSNNVSKELLEFLVSKAPETVHKQDREGWTPVDCLILHTENWNLESLDCLRYLLTLHPQVNSKVQKEKFDINVPTRLILIANPTLNPSLLRSCNWSARKSSIFLFLRLASNDHGLKSRESGERYNPIILDYLINTNLNLYAAKSNYSTLNEQTYDAIKIKSSLEYERMLVLLALTELFMSPFSRNLPSLLKNIVLFL